MSDLEGTFTAGGVGGDLASVLDDLPVLPESRERLRDAVPVIRYHHERWDGMGYPEGLAGEQIPVCAAIAGLADAWDAMTTDRPYQTAMPTGDALAEVMRGYGSQFSPAVVDAFLEALRRYPTVFDAPGGEPLADVSVEGIGV